MYMEIYIHSHPCTCTQECISSYDKAYSYFRAIGDDIHIAKTVHNIAHTYLQRVFSPVALLHFPYSEVCIIYVCVCVCV